MAMLGIDGLVSGLDTTALINQLMQVEAMPQTLLKAKQSATTSLVSALQALNVRVASLAEAATKAATGTSWNATKASASAASVTATTSTSSTPTELTFTVDRLAASQVALTPDLASLPTSGTLTFRAQDGTLTEVTVGADAAATARAISASDAGVNAVVVTANGTSRLQLTGKESGAEHAFTLYAGTKAQVEGGTAPAVTLATTREAADAQITLWKGSPAEQSVTSASNTFTGVVEGTSISVSKVETDPVTLTVSSDTDALKTLVTGLVGSLGVVLSEITSRTGTTTKTNEDGTTTVTGGLFAGDGVVRDLRNSLTSAASYGVDGLSPSVAGINIDRFGVFTVDEKKLAEALAADPEQVQKVVAGLAQRVADVAEGASDKYDGILTARITGQENQVKTLGTQIEAMDRRLELRRAGLERTYSALEVALSNLQSQSSWLAGQLSSLPTSSS